MTEKFAFTGGEIASEFLDLKHTTKSMFLVSLMIARFAPGPGRELWRASKSEH